jgi:peptide/nickel transport system substrate-binding protein
MSTTPEVLGQRAEISRRSALQLLASATGVTILAACTGTPTPNAVTTTVPSSVSLAPAATPQAAPPKAGGMLRMSSPGDITTTDGNFRDGNAFDSLWQVYDRLTFYNDKLEPQPMLAESWDLSNDLKQIKLSLRKGVQWHSGREFTSDDVKWSITRTQDPKVAAGNFSTQSSWFTTMDTPDKYTIVLASQQPLPGLFDFFEYYNILDRVSVEAPDAKSKAVGTGPFQLVEWVQGDHLTFSKNPNYWQAGKPYLDGMTSIVTGDASARMVAFEAGQTDVIRTPSWSDMARLKADPTFQAITNPLSGSFYNASFNTTMPPTDNKLVRQALNFAMDRKRFADTVMYGFTQPEVLLWKPSSPAYDASKNSVYDFDLDRAASLLEQANVSSIEMDYIVSPVYDELYQFGQIYQADLAKIGVKLNVKQLELAVWFDQANNSRYVGVSVNNGPYGQLEPVTNYTSSGLYNPARNNAGFKTDAYVQLVNQAATEPDAARRKQVYRQLNDLLVDEAFCVAMATGAPRMLARSNVHGIGYTLHEGFTWSDVWIG